MRTAAPLLGVTEEESEPVLERLVDVNLLITTAPQRYRMHDLVRTVAREQATERLRVDQRRDATTRLFRRIAAVAWRATELRGLSVVQKPLFITDWTEDAGDLDDPAATSAWLQAER